MPAKHSSRHVTLSLIAAAIIQTLGSPALATSHDWVSGYSSVDLTAPNPLPAGDTLNLLVGGSKFLNSPVQSTGTINAYDDLYFQSGQQLISGGLYEFKADVGLADGGWSGSFLNTGTLRKSGGAGASAISGIAFWSNGTIDVQTGSINFSSNNNTFGDGSKFTGAGLAVVNSNASFNGKLTSENLTLVGGNFTGSGAQINGTVSWAAGSLNGDWSVQSGSALNLTAGGSKYLGGSLINNGFMNAGDHLYLQSGHVLTNNNLLDLQGDVGLHNGGWSGQVINNGTLRKSSGTGESAIDGIVFINASNATIDVQSGVLNLSSGQTLLNDGTKLIGAGEVHITSNASFQGVVTGSNMKLLNGTYTGMGARINGTVDWTAGTLAGDWTLQSGSTVNLLVGSSKNLNGSLTNHGLLHAKDNLYLQSGNTLTNNEVFTLDGDVGVSDGGWSGSLINNGALAKTGGTGTSAIAGVSFVNNGVIEVQGGVMQFTGGSITFNDGTAMTGDGEVHITSNANFNGTITGSNMKLLNGTYTGNTAAINGAVDWSVGALEGHWAVKAGSTLNLLAGGDKFVGGGLVNEGTIKAKDTLFLRNGNTLTNHNLYELQGDVSINDGGWGGTVVNSGVFRKSAGAGTSEVGYNITFDNHGEINVQTGTLVFRTNQGLFRDGSQFTGHGQVVIAGNTTFVGGYTTNNNLTLTGNAITGGDGTAGSKGVMNGNTKWSNGSLAGTWEVGTGKTLTAQAGDSKFVDAELTNKGTVVIEDTISMRSGHTLANTGMINLRNDAGIADGGWGGHVVNTGLIVKLDTGTSSIGVALSNQVGGVIDVRSGTIQLPSNFSNDGTLKGAGAFTTNLLTNNGHLAPGSIGEAPATLTLNGNFTQTALGAFDIALLDATHFGNLLVNGAASLDGVLNLDCVGSCSIALGTQLVLMDSTAGVSGTFSSVAMHGFGTGAFSVQYLSNQVVLTVTQATAAAAVPEPESYALVLSGLMVAGAMVRRRRLN